MAIAFLACGVALAAQDRSTLLDTARSQIASRNFDGAIRSAQEYLRGDPGSVTGRQILANAYLMALRLNDALHEADAVLRDHPTEPEALKIKANAAYLMGDVATAKDTFIRLLEGHPADADGAYMLGRIYYQEGYLELATGQFERVLKLEPASYKALDNLGLCYEALGDSEKATRYFLAAIQLVEKDHPEYEWPYTNLAELLLKNGDARQAFNAASKATNRNPMSARGFYVGAKALDQLGKPDLALNWLQRSAALNDSSSDTWYLLARVYRKLQQNEKADEALEKFRALKAKEPARRR